MLRAFLKFLFLLKDVSVLNVSSHFFEGAFSGSSNFVEYFNIHVYTWSDVYTSIDSVNTAISIFLSIFVLSRHVSPLVLHVKLILMS